MDRNRTYLLPEDFPQVDDLLDWIVEKQSQGYKMPNPRQHFFDMKQLMRGKVEAWECRAGQNNLIIRTDGTLAPCFPMYSAAYDWGTVGRHQFDIEQLDEMKNNLLHALPLHLQPHPGPLLQQPPGGGVGAETGGARLPRCERKFRRLAVKPKLSAGNATPSFDSGTRKSIGGHARCPSVEVSEMLVSLAAKGEPISSV
jgi:hypothetical protein